jgi:hypothetical protein
MTTTEAALSTPTRRPAALIAPIGPVSFLEPFYAGVGVVIVALTLAPSVRAYYRR